MQEKTKKRDFHVLRLFNDFLSVIVLFLALYMMFSPFLPRLKLYYSQSQDNTQGYVYSSDLIDLLEENYKDPEVGNNDAKPRIIDKTALKPKPTISTLVIPKIGVDATILEGEDASTLDLGVWRRPNTSTPGQGSNTVLVAHRFLYTSGTDTFYNLDKLEYGDRFIVFWKNPDTDVLEEIAYEVFEKDIVPPTAIEIEDPTEEEIITLYTCTPIHTAENRLYIKAKPINLDEKKASTN